MSEKNESRDRIMEIITGVWDREIQIDHATDEIMELLSPAPSAPGDAQDEQTGGDVAYGIYRTRPDENGGKEFFYGAMWHDGTSLSKGERMVRGRFIPDDAPAAGDALDRDQQRLALWQAIRDITIGNLHDDKLILANLHKAGYVIALAAQVPQQGEA